MVLSYLSNLAIYIPDFVLKRLFPEWPEQQKDILKQFICSPSSVHASLATAHAEMNTIVKLDLDVLQTNRDKLWFYYGETDHWVGEERQSFLQIFDPTNESTQIIHGTSEVPHAFCISTCSNLQVVTWNASDLLQTKIIVTFWQKIV